MLSRRRSALRQRSRPDGERHPSADIARGLGAGKRAGRRLTRRAERTCNIFACQAAWPRRTNIPPDAELAVRNVAPPTRPAPLTHDECLRILAGLERRALPQNGVFPGALPKYHRNRLTGLLVCNFLSLAQRPRTGGTVR